MIGEREKEIEKKIQMWEIYSPQLKFLWIICAEPDADTYSK